MDDCCCCPRHAALLQSLMIPCIHFVCPHSLDPSARQDFYNLANVYLDAVFFPRAVTDPQVRVVYPLTRRFET